MNYEKKYIDLKKEFDDFVYIISHDFNAPLRAINNLSEWIEEDLVDVQNEDIETNFKLLKSRVNRLNLMVNASRSISRIERYELDIEEISTRETIENIISENHDLSTLVTSYKGEFPVLKTFSAKFKNVITEVLMNCKRHNNLDELQVEITGTTKADYFEISIKDNGIGIKENVLPKIFDLFYTVLPKDETEGIGAGLFYAKKIMDFVNGEIQAVSQLGLGTTIIIKWPINKK